MLLYQQIEKVTHRKKIFFQGYLFAFQVFIRNNDKKYQNMKKLIIFSAMALCLAIGCKRETPLAGGILNTELLPVRHFSITNDRDTLVFGYDGTKLLIHAGTFLNSKGEEVKGAVDLVLKEAIKMSDIVLGGLTTLSNGEVLQSGGMLYVNATSQGEQLKMANGHFIEASVPAAQPDSMMQLYRGEQASAGAAINWVEPKELKLNLVTDDTIPHTTLGCDSAVTYIQKIPSGKLKAIEEPLKPELKSMSDTIVSLEFDANDFPELAIYKDVKFKLANDPNFDPQDSNHPWINVEMEKTETRGVYIMKLSGFDNSGAGVVRKIRVKPVFSNNEDYTEAVKVYEKRFQSYTETKKEIAAAQLKEQRRREQAEREALENERRLLAEQKKQEQIRQREQEKINRANQLQEMKIRRQQQLTTVDAERVNALYSLYVNDRIMAYVDKFLQNKSRSYAFSIGTLGWSNIDRLVKQPESGPVCINVRLTDFNSYDNVDVSLAIDGQNIFLPAERVSESGWCFSKFSGGELYLPYNYSATIIVVGYKAGCLCSEMKKVQLRAKEDIVVETQNCTIDQFRDQLAILNDPARN